MAKPILLVGIPKTSQFELVHQMRETITRWVKDEYHVLIYHDDTVEEMRFQALNADDLTPLQFDELKEIVNNSIHSNV